MNQHQASKMLSYFVEIIVNPLFEYMVSCRENQNVDSEEITNAQIEYTEVGQTQICEWSGHGSDIYRLIYETYFPIPSFKPREMIIIAGHDANSYLGYS